jgi:hypothetical protein
MDYVQGRQCKTVLLKESDRQFRLYDKYFQRFRGTPVPVLERASTLLERSESSLRRVSFEHSSCLAAL